MLPYSVTAKNQEESDSWGLLDTSRGNLKERLLVTRAKNFSLALEQVHDAAAANAVT